LSTQTATATSSIPDETIAHNIANIKKDAWNLNLEAILWMLLSNIHLPKSEREITRWFKYDWD